MGGEAERERCEGCGSDVWMRAKSERASERVTNLMRECHADGRARVLKLDGDKVTDMFTLVAEHKNEEQTSRCFRVSF